MGDGNESIFVLCLRVGEYYSTYISLSLHVRPCVRPAFISVILVPPLPCVGMVWFPVECSDFRGDCVTVA
jgi:hypothetical protein